MLTIAWNLFTHRRRALLVYSVSMVLVVLMFAGIFPTIVEQADALEEIVAVYPQAFLDAFGIDNFRFDTFEKFLAVEYFSIMWPIALIAFALSIGSQTIAGEIERNTMEHLLAKPLSRTHIFLGTWLGGLAVLGVFTLVSSFAAVFGAWVFDIPYTFDAELAVAGISLGFAWAVYGIALLASAFTAEKGRAALFAGGVLLSMYLANIVSGMIEQVEWVKYTSVFYYFNYDAALVDFTIHGMDIGMLLGIGGVAALIAALRFNSRDMY